MDQIEVVTRMILQNKHTHEFCHGCVLSKCHRHSFVSQPLTTSSWTTGYPIHAEICGLMAHVSLGGAFYCLFFKDDDSGYCYIFCIIEKSEVFHYFSDSTVKFFMTLKIICRYFTVMEVENSTTRNSKNIFLKKVSAMKSLHLIYRNRMVPVSGIITVMESVRSLFHSNGYPLSFWAEACHTVVYTLKHIGSQLIPENTHFIPWCGFKPSVEHLKVFGCQAYAYIDKQHHNKLDPMSHLCYFLGYCDNTQGYWPWNPVTSKVLLHREVIFNEHILHGTSVMQERPIGANSDEWKADRKVHREVSKTIKEIQEEGGEALPMPEEFAPWYPEEEEAKKPTERSPEKGGVPTTTQARVDKTLENVMSHTKANIMSKYLP